MSQRHAAARGRPRDAPGAAGRPTRLRAWLALLLLVGTAACFAPAIRLPFVNFDDPEYVVENPHVHAGVTAAGVRWAFTATHSANWHPLTSLSHMADWELYGAAPTGPHATNVALHAANAALLFLSLERMTGAPWPSAFVAAAFALHPLRVESVAWVSERKDVLAGFFWMLALWLYAAHVARPGAGRYAGLLACFALGLLSKPIVVTLPLVLVLLNVWPLRRPWSGRIAAEIAPLLALSVAASVATYLAQRSWGAVASLETMSVGARAANAVVAYASYLAKTVWPGGLAVFYPRRPLPWWEVAGFGAVLLAITALAFRERRRRPYLLVGWLWYAGTLFPVSGVLQVGEQAMADRFTYLPQIGVLVMLAWGARELPLPRATLAATAGVALAASAALTVRQLGFWRDSATLFEHARRVTTDNYLAESNLGVALLERGDRAGATAHLREAIRLQPAYAKPHLTLGKALAEGRDADGARREYAEAIRLDPRNPMAHYNLGVLLVDAGRLDDGIGAYRESLRLDPEYAKAHHNLGAALAAEERFAEAVDEYRAALALAPEVGVAHGNLAIALEHLGRNEEALAEYRIAAALMPGEPRARYNLAACLVAAGRLPEAAEELRAALRLRPDWPEGRQALAEVEGRMAEHR